ncbi:nuclear transport factor 2 family protein [Polaromonas jejuensis]|uniref:Nuclear transport factor 2 family protein n=1 Tax=Polaromonas jejuensis TaxID=457502 RepID=A0ABW0QB80_9BURK|nr:nuclear transport factor 2 family protein [Polaromonas jejuensis]
MHPNQTRLENFYAAFARLDAEAMAACYARDAQFDDEVFSLRGQDQVAGMWRMLCAATQAKGADVWKLSWSGVQADARSGKAHWEADYRFSATGRLVHNAIDGVFEFSEDGLIARHRDRFDFWAWSRQALGAPGLLLGWTPLLRRKVRAQAAANLQKYLTQRRS